MLRTLLLWLSTRPGARAIVTGNPIGKRLARRFVAGETLDEAFVAVRALNGRGVTTTLDLLGESVRNEQQARAAGDAYIQALDRIDTHGLTSHVSLKLTAMGLDISEELCVSNLERVIQRALDTESFVRVDMEGSAYTERTLRLVEERLAPRFPNRVGVVLQSYLRRTREDVRRANWLGVRVRLCKGAYREPSSIAFPKKRDVDQSYIDCMKELLEHGRSPAIATHDEAMILETMRYAADNGITADRYEFQMLYGVRRDLQAQLIRDGYRLRVYIPFGTQWYPYFMRRLAERPANMAFIAGSLAKEAMRRR